MKKFSLTAKISISLILGAATGFALRGYPEIATNYIKPIGTIYLNLIKMIVVPVVLLSVVQGTISLRDVKKVGSVGIRTIIYYFITTAIAITIGLFFANILNVGSGYTLSAGELTYEATEAPRLMDTLVNIFPSNAIAPLAEGTMLQILVIAIFFSFGIILAGEKGKLAADIIESLAEVALCIMNIIIQLAAVGVFALICPVVAENGTEVLLPLIKVIFVAYIAYAAHTLAIYSAAVRLIGGMSPVLFFKNMWRPILIGFSSASSMGVLPFNMEAVDRLGVSKGIYSFVLPLGATVNMDGTAIYQGVCAVFISQIFGIELNLSEQLTIILTATLASIGTAGVPGSGMIMLAMVLQSVGLPLEGVALVAGIDRILDMGRTAVNITGDASCAVCINALDKKRNV